MVMTARGLALVSRQGLGQSFEQHFKDVWGKYFPFIALGVAGVAAFFLVRRFK